MNRDRAYNRKQRFKHIRKRLRIAKSIFNSITIFNEFKKAEEVSTFETLVQKGDDAYRQQKYKDAIDYYTKAVVFNPLIHVFIVGGWLMTDIN